MKKLSIKQALLDLLSVADQLPRILKEYPEFNDLLFYMLEKDFCNDMDLALPTVKYFENNTGLKPHQVGNQIRQMYDIVFIFNKPVLRFNKVVYDFMISYRGKYFGFILTELPVIPRIGENFEVPFAKAALGFDSFVVKDITYTLKSDKQIVGFILKGELNRL